MDKKVMFQLSYGLFVLSAKDGEKQNGCIINTAMQVTDSPLRMAVAVNKGNKTCEMIEKTGEFNISVLTEKTQFEVFSHFGFQSGRVKDKFEGWGFKEKAKNGIYYLTGCTNAYISGKVVQTIDLDTHYMFIADVTEGEILSNEKSVTYTYYQQNIKPKPAEEKKKGYTCTICGFVYEGDELPPDYICPICKHGVDAFVKN